MENDNKVMNITMDLPGRSYSVLTPVITTQRMGYLDVDIPLFKLNTIAAYDDDVEVAVAEAVQCFCTASNKEGRGIEKELKSLGIIP
jgi:hypothetical protein